MAFTGVSPEEVQRYMHIPASKPPPGINASLNDPPQHYLATNDAVNALGLIITTALVAIRIYTRGFVLKRLWWDDCKPFETPYWTSSLTKHARYLHCSMGEAVNASSASVIVSRS